MFRSLNKPFLIICLLIIDLLLIINIEHNKTIGLTNNSIATKKIISKNNPKTKIEGVSDFDQTLSLTPSPTPTQTPIPTLTPIPTPQAATPNPTQTQTQTTISNTSLSQQLLDQVNAFRASKGLPAVQTDGYTCGFATIRSNEITSGFNHDGFNNRASSHTLPYPSYTSVTENIAENSDPTQVVNAWIASPGHNENMQKDTPFVCIANLGNYYAYEGWKP